MIPQNFTYSHIGQHKCRENTCHSLVIELGHADQTEVPHESLGNIVSTPARRSHSR